MKQLIIATINCQGQTKLSLSKQHQIEHFIKQNNIDILFCQETAVFEDTFKGCHFIEINYNVIHNNASNEYGTSIIVKNNIETNDIAMDTQGRIITFNSGSSTFVNVYPKSGTDVESRREREQMFTTTLPNMLVHRKENIIIGGDWNAIINNIDATHYPEAKQFN